MPESSRPSKPRADNAGMTSRPTLAIPKPTPPSATAGSPATSRPATSNGRSPSCNSSTPTLKSSPTLHPDSTTAERDLLPYWNDYTGAISSHLWLPTATDSLRFGTELIEQILQQNGGELLVLNQRDFSPPEELTQDLLAILLSSLPEPTDSEGTGRKSRKIRIYPDRHQRGKLKLWFDAGRFTYNRTIELLTSDGAPKASWLTIKKDILTRLPDWTKPAPYEVKSHAIRDACLAISAAKKFNRQLTADKARGLRQEGNYARAHFRSRKNPSQTIFIHASALSQKGVYHTILGELKRREPIPHAHGDSKLTLSHHQYHLSVPFKRMGPHLSESNLESNLRSQAPDQVRVVALDPGVRNFITWFSEDGCGKLGERLRTNSEAVPAPGQSAVPCRAGAVQKTAKHAPGRRKNDRQNSEPDKRTPPQDSPVPGRQLRRHTAA